MWALGALSCHGGEPSRPVSAPVVPSVHRPAASVAPGHVASLRRASVAAAPVQTIRATSALRCGECHGRTAAEWRHSLHARSVDSPVFQAMRGRSNESARCDACHQPLAAIVEKTDRAGREGVTCDACHRIRSVEARRAGAGFTIERDMDVKYGPLCGLRDHYFHRMGCSPLHRESRFCAACHLYYRRLPSGAALPVYTEFEEWRSSPEAATGMECQTCHMPGRRGAIARGSAPRESVPDHGLLGVGGRLRRKALTLGARLGNVGATSATVEVVLTNGGAGHRVPSGAPGRRVVLRVRSLDRKGAQIDGAERVYGRVLVDASGREAPFYAAVRVASDNRLAPGERRQEELGVAVTPGGTVEVQLAWLPCSPEIAATLGASAGAEELLRTVRLHVPRAHRGHDHRLARHG